VFDFFRPRSYHIPEEETMKSIRSLAAGLYAWACAVFFGMVLLDIFYARLVPGAQAAFDTVSDLLLAAGFLALTAGALAALLRWNEPAARNFLVASLLFLLLEFFLPLALGPLLANATAPAAGPWLRIVPTGAASILAIAGVSRADDR
jgi:hypothetical protein